jgi:hypothetical protein
MRLFLVSKALCYVPAFQTYTRGRERVGVGNDKLTGWWRVRHAELQLHSSKPYLFLSIPFVLSSPLLPMRDHYTW